MGKNYLLTGINGFIAPHLANLLLERGDKVYGLIREPNNSTDILDVVSKENFDKINFLQGDVVDEKRMEYIFNKNQFSGVFHFAGQCHPPTSFLYPRETFQSNAVGTVNIVEGIRKYQPECKLMFASTGEVYGAVPEEKGSITEDFPLMPVNPYGVSKVAAEHYVKERANSENLPFFITRSFSLTGPRRRENFAISSDAYQIARIKKGLQEPVIRVGNLEAKRIVTDVRNMCDAYAMLMDNFVSGEAYNVSGNAEDLYRIGDLLEMMLEIGGVDATTEIESKFFRPIDIPTQVPDSTKCKKQTGWSPKIPIRQTLNDLLNYAGGRV